MATYSPAALKIKSPVGGFQEGGWYSGRQYIGGTLSEPGQIHPSSNQVGAGQLVSPEVNAQSAQAQGKTAQELESYLQQQRQQQAQMKPVQAAPVAGAGQTMTSAGMATGTGAGVAGLGMQTQATLNLPDLYNNLYKESGITDKEQALVTSEKQFLEAKGKISDNPFLSASMIDQRLQRLQRKYEEETAPIRSEVAQKKADIETKLQLQTKQFDINSQATKDAFTMANSLLESGALNNASGEDIAQLVRATGVPSSMWQSAIQAKNQTKADTQIIQSEADDGTVTVSTINKNTGEIINQQSLGRIGNKQTSGGGSSKLSDSEKRQSAIQDTTSYLAGNQNSYGHVDRDTYLTARRALIAEAGISPKDFDALFSDYRDPYNTQQYQLTE